MADPIRDTTILDGDASGLVTAGKQAEQTLTKTTASSKGLLGGLLSYSQGIIGGILHGAGQVAKVGGIIAGVGSLAAKGLSGVGALAGGVASSLLGVGAAAGTVATSLGVILGQASQYKSVVDATKAFGKEWEKTKAILLSPFVQFLTRAWQDLTAVLKDPAVQVLVQRLGSVIAVVMKTASDAVHLFIASFHDVAVALGKGDIVGAARAIGQGVIKALDSVTGGAFSNGLRMAQEFANGIIQGTQQFVSNAVNFIGSTIASFLEGHSPPPKGPLSTIDRWGVVLMNTFLAGFNKADFGVLDATSAIIKQKLQSLADLSGSKADQIAVIPRLLGSQAAIASALTAMRAAGGLTDEILGRVRAQLASLGQPVIDFVTATLQAADAEQKVADQAARVAVLQGTLVERQKELAAATAAQASVEAEAETLRRAQATRLATLHPLEQQILDDEQALNALLITQQERRHEVERLARQLIDAEAEVKRLQADQVAQLAGLVAQRNAVADAAERQRAAEAEVTRQRDALLPLEENLAAAQADYAAAQQAAGERDAARQAALEAAQQSIDAAIERQNALLEQVDARYTAQIADQQAILDGIDRKYEAELAGADKALDAAKAYAKFVNGANDERELGFAREAEQANKITNPNQRLAALAKIARAQKQYEDQAQYGLKRAELEQKVRQEQVDTVQAKVDAEKQGATEQIKTLQALQAGERDLINARIKSINEEGKKRLDGIRAANAAAKAGDDAALAAVKARVDSAQASVTAQNAVVTAAARAAELAGRSTTEAQAQLAAAEQEVRDRTDGAIKEAETRAASIEATKTALDQQLADERAGLEARLADEREVLALRKSQVDEVNAAEQIAMDKRLQDAGDLVKAAGERVTLAQGAVNAAGEEQARLSEIVDNYKAAADLAAARIKAEAEIAALLKQQRDLTAPEKEKGGGGKPGPKATPKLNDTSFGTSFIADATAKFEAFVADIRKITDPLGSLISDIIDGRWFDSIDDLRTLGDSIGDIIERIFGKEVRDKIQLVTDPIGKVAEGFLRFFGYLQQGEDPLFAVQQAFAGLLPPDLLLLIGSIADAFSVSFLPKIQEIAEKVGPKLTEFFQNLKPGIDSLVPALKIIGEVLGGVVVVAFGLFLSVLSGALDALPFLGIAISGLMEIVSGAVQGIFGIIELVASVIAAIVTALTGGDMAGAEALFRDGWNNLVNGVIGIVTGLKDAVIGLIAGLGLAVQGTIQGLIDTVVGFFQRLFDDLVGHSIVVDLVNAVEGLFTGMRDSVVGFAKGIWEGVTGFFSTLLTDGTKLVSDLATGAIKGASDLKDGILKAASDTWIGATSFLGNLLTDGLAKVTSLKDEAITQAGLLASGVIAGAVKLKDDGIAAITGFVSGALTALGQAVTDGTTKAGEIASGVVDGVVSLATTGPAKVATAIGSLINGLIDTAKGLLGIPTSGGNSSVLSGIGGDIVGGLTSGLQAAWHFVQEKVTELTNLIPAEIRSLLDSHSDSEETKSIGVDVVGGLATGIAESAQLAIDAMTVLGQQILQVSTDLFTSLALLFSTGWQPVIDGNTIGATAFITSFIALFSTLLPGIIPVWDTLFAADAGREGTLLNRLWGHQATSFWTYLLAYTNTKLDQWFGGAGGWQQALDLLASRISGYLRVIAASDMALAAAELGKQIVLGIAAGISTATHFIEAAARAAVLAAIAAADKTAETGSPAKAFMPTGKNMGQGVAVGVEQAIPDIEAATADLVGSGVASAQDAAAGSSGSLQEMFGSILSGAQALIGAVGGSGALDKVFGGVNGALATFGQFASGATSGDALGSGFSLPPTLAPAVAGQTTSAGSDSSAGTSHFNAAQVNIYNGVDGASNPKRDEERWGKVYRGRS